MGGIQRWPGGRNTPFSLSVSPLAGTVRAVVLLPRPPPRPLVALSPEQTPPDDGTSVCVCVYVCVHTCMHVHVHVRKGGSKIVKWEGWPGGRNTPFSLSVSPRASCWNCKSSGSPTATSGCLVSRTNTTWWWDICVCVCEREREREWNSEMGGVTWRNTPFSLSVSPLARTVRAVVLLPRPLVALSPERTPPDDGTSVCVCVWEREREREREGVK